MEEPSKGSTDTDMPARCHNKPGKKDEGESENNQHTQNNECNQNSLMQTILHELKCIKETIHYAR